MTISKFWDTKLMFKLSRVLELETPFCVAGNKTNILIFPMFTFLNDWLNQIWMMRNVDGGRIFRGTSKQICTEENVVHWISYYKRHGHLLPTSIDSQGAQDWVNLRTCPKWKWSEREMMALSLNSPPVGVEILRKMRRGFGALGCEAYGNVNGDGGFPSFLPKEVEKVKDPFARSMAQRIQRLPVQVITLT